jgi:hypothetical protein
MGADSQGKHGEEPAANKGGRPRLQRMSLRAAVCQVSTDQHILDLATSLMESLRVQPGEKPDMQLVSFLSKLVPHVPSALSLERARQIVASGNDEIAREALAILFAHAQESADPEIAKLLVDAVAKFAAAQKTQAETPNANGQGTIVFNVVPHAGGATTSITVAKPEADTDEVK